MASGDFRAAWGYLAQLDRLAAYAYLAPEVLEGAEELMPNSGKRADQLLRVRKSDGTLAQVIMDVKYWKRSSLDDPVIRQDLVSQVSGYLSENVDGVLLEFVLTGTDPILNPEDVYDVLVGKVDISRVHVLIVDRGSPPTTSWPPSA